MDEWSSNKKRGFKGEESKGEDKTMMRRRRKKKLTMMMMKTIKQFKIETCFDIA